MTNLQSKSSSGVSNITPPKDGTQLLLALNKYSAPWERLDIVEGTLQHLKLEPFLDVLNIPKTKVSREVLSGWQCPHQALFRALALQAFGKIEGLKEKSKIASLRTNNNSLGDFAPNLLFILQQEATGGPTKLIRWSAAWAINSIWCDPQYLNYGKTYKANVQIEAELIEQEIKEEEIKQLERFKEEKSRKSNTGSNDFSADYKKYLEFWVYGPSWVLFNLPHNSQEYQVFINDVLGELKPRGVKLGVDSTNHLVVELSLKFAQDLFNYSDKNYVYYFQREISNCLERFLNSDSKMQIYKHKAFYFRKLAAESIVKLHPELWKNDKNLKYLKARAAVILERWKLVETLGEVAVFSLLEVGQGFLQPEAKQNLRVHPNFEENQELDAFSEWEIGNGELARESFYKYGILPNLNLDIRVKAVRTIGAIKFKNDEDKIIELEKFLQVPEEIIRYESASLLKPYLGKLPPKWHAIVTALLYQFNGLLSPSLDIISIEQIKQYIDDAKNDQRAINSIFEKASGYCENDAFEIKNFFNQKLNECEIKINAHIEKLKGQISKVEQPQALVKQNAQRILSALKGIKSACPEIYNQLIPLEKQAQDIKDAPLSSYSFNKAVESNKKLDFIKNSINSSLLKASQDLEKNIEKFIDDLDFTISQEIKTYIDDAGKEWEAIHKAFECAYFSGEENIFDVDLSDFKQKFDEFRYKISAYLKTLNGQLLKIEKLQALVKQNAQRILSALKGIKLVCPEMYNQLMPLEKQAKHIKDAPLSSYSFNKAVESNKKLDSIKNSINSSLLKASQDLEKNLEQFIDDLDFTISAEIKTYIDNAGKEWEAIHKAFESAPCFGGESIFDVDYSYFKEKFDKSQDNINAYLKTLNSQLLKIEKLQAAIQRNTELIVSTLNKTKSTDRELHQKLRDSEEQVQEISPIKGSSYSYKKIDDLKQRLAGIKNSIDSGLRQAINKLENQISQLSKDEKKLRRGYQENRVWWRNFVIILVLFVVGSFLSFVLYLSDYGLGEQLVAYNDSWQFRSDGLGAIFLSLLWLPFHVVLTWFFLLIYFAVVPLFFVWYAFKLLKGVVLLPKQIKETFERKRKLAEAGLEARAKKQQDKLDAINNILNELLNKWEYMK